MQTYNIKDFNNFYIYNIMQAGPDFMPNMWHAVIIADDDVKSSIFDAAAVKCITDQTESIKSSLSSNALAVRLESFTIPQPKFQTGSVSYGYRTLTKISPVYDMNKKLTLEIPLDQNMYLFDVFMMASNAQVNRTITSGTLTTPTTLKYLNALLPVLRNRRQPGEIYDEAYNANYDIAVLHSLAVDDSVNLLVWIFKDVHFLGHSNSLDLDNTSANDLKLSVPFTYKRMYQLIDPSQLTLPSDAIPEKAELLSGYSGETSTSSSSLA